MTVRISLKHEEIAAFCQRWQITELPFFGSVLRDDFRPESDVDVLVTFAPGGEWSLFDHIAMEVAHAYDSQLRPRSVSLGGHT